MKFRSLYAVIVIITISVATAFSKEQSYSVNSPDGKIQVAVNIDGNVTYSVTYNGNTFIESSPISMTLDDGRILGKNIKERVKGTTSSVNRTIQAPFYRFKEVNENYNMLTLSFKGGYSIEFRAFNEGMAYRFATSMKDSVQIKSEEAIFNFNKDYTAYIPYSPSIKQPFQISFESRYTISPISGFEAGRYSIVPLLVDLGNGSKAVITESDLRSYPGMFLYRENGTAFKGAFAHYPAETILAGGKCQEKVLRYSDIIAKTEGNRTFPWRIVAVSSNDTELPVNNLVYLLGEESRIKDTSWIKPGRASWDWWNNWGLTGTDFVPGVNTETYKYHIDFAAANGLEYIVIDEGWYPSQNGDMFDVVPALDLEELVEYGNSKNVGIILWGVTYVFDKDAENICKKYSEMGIKGFKLDFLDRDDQQAVEVNYRILETAAKYHLVMDLHGMYKPTGLNRTFPHLLNYEGVWGLEQMKWSKEDMVTYDVTFPYIRMLAGPVDYTPGAMRNSQKGAFSPSRHPMSQGTRSHQVAEYIVFDAPLVMLADSPSAYMKEQETTDFISAIPSVFDETRIISGEIGKYIVTARRSGNTWYIGGLNGHGAKEIEIDLSFIKNISNATIFRDGTNSHKIGEDYKKEGITIPSNGKIKVKMATGGGFAMIINK